ncbi:oxoglutarate-dependent flavonoid 7-O-demethylase 1-like [Lotus japonicus]|uniref:oxoglutarate-dependent flavonoid 7-O-demethylase 1-like n=1 Tax=Lotus japonicus TaxID=34305 RepID=UPI00259102BB|nr:oxoglutarate-dependent flavonoid 7-O-demethylase 1-like [Lotus japonicus]
MDVTSLPVPFVQELAKKEHTRVPERYVRPHDENAVLYNNSSTTPLPQVPVIDLSKLLSKDLKVAELERLHLACKEWGFFQLINHGVNTSLVENVKKDVQEFFNLPLEQKKKFEQKQGDSEGYGQLFVVSEDQKLDWGDVFYMVTLPQEKRKPHLFPKLPSTFRDDLETYCVEMKKLAIKILELMANALTIETAEMTEHIASGTQLMRFNYYPPCIQPELVMGLNHHSDAGGLTILLQANDVEGLQVKKDGMWIPIKPLSNAFIVNIGDILEIITNGIYRSIEHRATVNSEKERLSIATFHSPSMESTFGPAPSLITPTAPAMFKPITYEEYLKRFLARELRGKSFIDTLRIENENEKS